MSKTKELLEGLGNIIRKPSAFAEQKYDSYTNRFYTSQKAIQKLPASYDKAKRHKDEDGEEYVMIDRGYGGLYGQHMTQADGTTYKGKLHTKRRLIKSKNPINEDVSFYSRCTMTADGRWFDNGGMPIETPTKLEPEKVKSQEELDEEARLKAERETAMLSNLK